MGQEKEEGPVSRSSEKAIINKIFLKGFPSGKRPLVGPGDDTAVLRKDGRNIAITKDILIEDVHFDLACVAPSSVGEKAVHVNVSDLAAMGAHPAYALLAIGIPPDKKISFVRAFDRGFKKGLDHYGMGLLGGDTVRSDKVVVSVTAIGIVSGRPVRRKGGRSGDGVYISGVPGLSCLGLALLKSGAVRGRSGSGVKNLALDRHLRPAVDVSLGTFLRKDGVATSMIDTSDGLMTDLDHLLDASGRGAILDLESIPGGPGVIGLCRELGLEWQKVALFGGEDYHLLFTVPPSKENILKKWKGSSPLYRIGVVTAKKGIYMKTPSGIEKVRGEVNPLFEHFG